MPQYDLFAVTAHGIAHICAEELARMGISGTAETGGVAWRGDSRDIWRANLELRTASRVIARAGEFRARGFAELERRVAKLPWDVFLAPGATVTLRVTCRKSKLYHEGAVAERVGRVLADTAGAVVEEPLASDDDADDIATNPGQLIIVRFLRDTCTISVDTSGPLLHLRGYRQAVAKAPLRETLAAALLHAAGWTGDTALVDPLCGSGTIPIEAALMAARIAPGIATAERKPRAYAFEQWPDFDRAVWEEVVTAARNAVRPVTLPIIGSDRDAGAISAARANAARAGVEGDVEFRRATLDELALPGEHGHLVTNPPYGVRVGDRRDLHALYAALGRKVAGSRPGWSITLLAADDGLAAATRLPLEERLATRNGGIPVRVLTTSRRPHTEAPAVYDVAQPDEEIP